ERRRFRDAEPPERGRRKRRAGVALRRISQAVRHRAGGRRAGSDRAAGRGRRPARAQRLRQDHDPASDRRVRDAGRGHDRGRRATGLRTAVRRSAGAAPDRDGVPGLRPVPPPLGRAQRRLRAAAGPGAGGTGGGGTGAGWVGGFRRSDAARALRRPAAAGRPGPRPGPGTGGDPARRAVLQPGCRVAGFRPGRGPPDPRRRRPNGGAGDPRPGGSPQPGRPDRGHGRGAGGPGGRAGGGLPPAGDQGRCRLRRRRRVPPRRRARAAGRLRPRRVADDRPGRRPGRGDAAPGKFAPDQTPGRHPARGECDGAGPRLLRPRPNHDRPPRHRPRPPRPPRPLRRDPPRRPRPRLGPRRRADVPAGDSRAHAGGATRSLGVL
ncbi:MAG: Ferric iron ABC transporter, ATP-binding protein, partial [uncultured Thermomicrobiales bacterium]